MPGSYFVVQNGLQVGPLSISATTGDISTSGNVNITGNLGVSQISDGDTSVSITDAGGSGSQILFTIDGGVEHTMTSEVATLNSNVVIDDVGYLQVPIGTTAERPGTPEAGMIRYNTTQSTYEGYGTAWASLGGVKSVDQLTYIQAETSPGASNDELEFFTANGASTTTRAALMDQYKLNVNGNLFVSPVTDGINVAETHALNQGLTDLIFYGAKSVNAFVQLSAHNINNGGSASTDFIVYADTGDNYQGFMDMGICSTGFNDPAFGITTAGDGYIFLSAPMDGMATPTGGNLVLATADGFQNDIVFAAGGFFSGTEQGRFVTGDGLYVTGNLTSTGGAIYQGPDAKNNLISANSTTTLSGNLNSTATTVNVVSTSGFLNHGALVIGDEILYYGSKTGTSFGSVVRGRSNTDPISHLSGNLVYQDQAGLTNSSAIFVGDADDFVQFAIKNMNPGAGASTDLIAYASNGDNNSGWVDLGITSETFTDTEFGVTGRDDGYIFMSAPLGTPGNGDLFLSTDDTGQQNDIVFSTNGFQAGTERMRLIGNTRPGKPAGVEIYINTQSTSTSTGALRVSGGVGIQGNVNVGGDVNIVGNLSFGGNGTTTSTTTLLVENGIQFVGNSNTGDSQDLGEVGQYVIGGTTKYTGLVRQAGAGWRLFDGLTTKPTNTVSWGAASLKNGNLLVGSQFITNATSSTTTTTGALVVTGGVGIGESLNIATSAYRNSRSLMANYTGATAPSNAYAGDHWYDSSTDTVFEYIFDGVGNQWVDTSGFVASQSNTFSSGITVTGVATLGNVTASQITMSGAIIPSANNSVNLGSSTAWFNTVYGVASQAKYADLAEHYKADNTYEPGTVLVFGGQAEVTTTTTSHDVRTAGVVSTDPAYLMNAVADGVAVALTGRVPCKVQGPIKKGDRLVTSTTPGVAERLDMTKYEPGCIIGKSLEDCDSDQIVTIEIAVGRY